MEATHPLFLPRLVPHLFGLRQSSPKKMSLSRSLTPMSESEDQHTTSTPTYCSPTPMPTTEDQPAPTSTFNRDAMIYIMRALFHGDPNKTTEILRRINPRAVVSAFAALASGGKDEHEIMVDLLLRLCKTDPVAAKSLLLSLFNSHSYNFLVSMSANAGM